MLAFVAFFLRGPMLHETIIGSRLASCAYFGGSSAIYLLGFLSLHFETCVAGELSLGTPLISPRTRLPAAALGSSDSVCIAALEQRRRCSWAE